MILSMSNQAALFLTTVLAGFAIGFIFDLFRVFRKTIRHPNFLTQIEDIIFWIIVTLFLFYIMVDRNYGEIRAFSIVGAFVGMVLYFCTLSILFLKVSEALITFAKKVAAAMIKIIFAPFKLMYKIMYPPFKACKSKFLMFTKRGLHKSKKYVKMKSIELTNDLKIITKKV